MEKKPNAEKVTAKPENNNLKEPKHDYPDISSVVSANEMTGLMNLPPEDEAELESYKDIAAPAGGEK